MWHSWHVCVSISLYYRKKIKLFKLACSNWDWKGGFKLEGGLQIRRYFIFAGKKSWIKYSNNVLCTVQNISTIFSNICWSINWCAYNSESLLVIFTVYMQNLSYLLDTFNSFSFILVVNNSLFLMTKTKSYKSNVMPIPMYLLCILYIILYNLL